MTCRLIRFLPIALFFAFAFAGADAAQAGNGSFNVSWSALDPGDDWAWKTIQSVFPVNGAAATSTGAAANVIGQVIGQLTGFVMAIAMAFICYLTIINIHRVSETSRLLTNSMTSLAVVRIGFAAIMMLPTSSGFSVGQSFVIQAAGWGIGMARSVYTNVVQAIGPDAMIVADPIIPGAGTTILNLMEDELCAAFVNVAAASTIVPAPTATVAGSSSGGGVVTYTYALSAGNATDSPACGSITLNEPLSSTGNYTNLSNQMAQQQQQILENTLSTLRPQIQSIANNYWQTKNQTSLSGLQSIYTSTVQSYTSQLTTAAQSLTQQLRSSQQSQDARTGNLGLIQNETQLSALGWTSAGAYYLEFARLNGLTLSLASATPVINTPSFQGLSPALTSDIGPLFFSTTSLLGKLKIYVNTQDGLSTPSAYGGKQTGQYTGGDPNSTLEQVFRALNITPALLNSLVNNLSPTTNQWSDPFGGLIALGNKMILAALAIMGTAAALTTTVGTVSAVGGGLASGGIFGGLAAAGAASVINFLSTPIFVGAGVFLAQGQMIAYVLPMIPWVVWMAGVAGYLILVCEAFVAVPLWMLAHMTFEGEGLHGRGGPGYELIFNVLFRPTLMLLGLFLGYFIFASMAWLISMSFGIAAGFVLANGWLVTNVLGFLTLMSVFILTNVTAAVMSFRMVSLIPHHLPRLIGFSGGNRVDMNEFAQLAAYKGTENSVNALTNRTQSVFSSSQKTGSGGPYLPASGSRTAALPASQSTTSSLDSTLQATTGMRSSQKPTDG
ncbi:DotA/TraY family protein [uncultured Rhodoblastus sp.]|uniref:DotA/TraY family protein n=1 Tax=uncultured Rhodoblastus sp. TaxID=543037 RepID=UPI0025D41C14|nr:DotA/TraY family protein [uncultured Rhodoblastus sp.]